MARFHGVDEAVIAGTPSESADADVDPGVKASVSMAARIPGARFVGLPDTGHLSALEQPDAFAAALLNFASTLPPPAA